MSAFISEKIYISKRQPHLVHNKDIVAERKKKKREQQRYEGKSQQHFINVAICANHEYDFFKWL